MDAGSQLQQAREARGLTREDLSARTKISPAILEAIEDGVLDRLPADFYLRGFIRAYAAEVGLPAGETVQQYLDERDRTSRALSVFESEDTIVDSSVDLHVPKSSPLDQFASESDAPAPTPSPATRMPEPTSPVAPVTTMRVPLPASLVASLAAGVLLAVVGAIASRWIASTEPVTLAAMPSATAPLISATPSSPSPAPVVAETATVAPAPAARVAPARTVAGEWTLTNRVRTTNYKAFEGLQLGYRLRLAQDGDTITGSGEKWAENGRAVPESGRTPIAITGTFRDGLLDLAFTERGVRRTSAGRFTWMLSDDGDLRGTFASDAARSEGTSYARRAE